MGIKHLWPFRDLLLPSKMLPFTLLSLASLAVSLPSITDPVPVDSIVGGTPVNPPFKYPWLVSLQQRGSHFCGGSLLDADTIVTAAHCANEDELSPSLRVVAHRHNLRASAKGENGLTFEVTRIINHPSYNETTNAYDVSVWKVNLIEGDASQIPVGLVRLDSAKPNADLTIAGWGNTREGGSKSSVLLEATVQVVSQADCEKH